MHRYTVILVGFAVAVVTAQGVGYAQDAAINVIELDVALSDEIPAVIAQRATDHGLPIRIADGAVWLGPAALAALRRGGGDARFAIGAGVTGIDDLKYLIVEKLRYAGRGRWGRTVRYHLAAKLLPLAFHGAPPKEASFGPLGNMDLDDIIPWPSGVSWRMDNDGRLVVKTGRSQTITPGKDVVLPEASAEVVLVNVAYAAAKKGDRAALHPKSERRALGKVRFSTKVSVRFLGRLRLETTP